MKRLLLLIIFTLSVVFNSYGQSQNKLSLAAGVNFSSVSSINSTNPDGALGLNLGVAYKFYMNDLGWFIKPALFYSQEGWLHQRLNYINLPAVVGFDFTDDFNFNIGFQYGYLVSNFNSDAIDRSNLAFLIGFEFYPTETFDVGLRFSNGIKNIIANPDDLVIKDARTFSIQFYFAFNLSKKDK